MKYNKLAGTNIGLSCLGLGCLQLGGHGWGKVSEAEMISAVHEAIDSEVNFLDTAPIYGLGRSEELLGNILGKKRNRVILATKVGLRWKKADTFEKFPDGSPTSINREIEASLKRLRTDYIDLYQIHWPDPNTPLEETLAALEKLKKAGKILYIGCCNFSLELIKESLKYAKVNTVQIPYSLIDRKVEVELLPFCKENGVGVLVYSPIGRGLLSGKYDEHTQFGADDLRNRNTDDYFQGSALQRNLKVVERVKSVAQRLNKTPTQIALRWVLQNPFVMVAMFGAKNIAQVKENVAASDFTLSKADMEFLNSEEV